MRRIAATIALFLAACPPPSAADSIVTSDPRPDESSSGVTAGSTSSTGDETTDGSTGAVAETTGTDEPESTGDEPQALPEVVSVELSPDPIEVAGPITLAVATINTDEVVMSVDDAPAVKLEQVEPGKFVGEIPVFSSAYNGGHLAEFTPRRGVVAGETVGRMFTAVLPKGGSEARWEVSGDLNEALGEAIAVGPDGEVYEFGRTDPLGDARCYLRVRGPDGEYGQDDVIAPVLPDTYCMAKKVAFGPAGELFLLADVKQNGVTRWWLGRMKSWDSPVEHLMWGSVGAMASGLTVSETGRVAVCGTKETAYGDRDAFVEIHGELSRTFDFMYVPEKDMPHFYSEVIHDCIFDDDVLVLAGELWGFHPNDVPMERTRHLVFEFDKATDGVAWNIADKGPAQYVQSGARAITRDDGGGYVTAGYVCEDPCIPQLHLRQFLAGTEYVDDFMPPVITSVPTDIAYSPAGYVVYVGARKINGWWTDLWAQAWVPGAQKAEWTYTRSDEMSTHMAQGVAIGKYGRVYLIGIAVQAGVYRPVFVLLNP